MNDKTTALITAGNAMAARLRQYSFVSDLSDDWDAALAELDDDTDAKLPYLLGWMAGRCAKFNVDLEGLFGADILKSSYAYGYTVAYDETFAVRDAARDSVLRYKELLGIARDLATAVSLPGSNVRATDAVARLRALDK